MLSFVKRKTNSNEFDAQDRTIAGNGIGTILLKRSTNNNKNNNSSGNNSILNFRCEIVYMFIYIMRRIYIYKHYTPGWNAGSASETTKSNFCVQTKRNKLTQKFSILIVCVCSSQNILRIYGNFMWILSCFNVSAEPYVAETVCDCTAEIPYKIHLFGQSHLMPLHKINAHTIRMAGVLVNERFLALSLSIQLILLSVCINHFRFFFLLFVPCMLMFECT